MTPLLSIIVPCFNAESTLTQAVDSIVTQELTFPFEVIFVDDASTDATPSLVKLQKKKFSHSKIITHAQNRGGGAARNTGIRASKGTYLLCLDSDNYFASDTVNFLLDAIQTKQADGVVFEHRKFFYKSPLISTIHTNPIRDQSFSAADLFCGSGLLIDNFLFSRQAYDRTDGYPENHGFDTQCFETRFLVAHNTLFTAPQTLIFHRQGAKEKSYFERVYEHGDFSINMFYIYEEMLSHFDERVAKKILEFDVFDHSSLEDNIQVMLSAEYKKSPAHFFAKKSASSSSVVSKYIRAYAALRERDGRLCVKICLDMIQRGFHPNSVYLLLLRAGVSEEVADKSSIEPRVHTLLEDLRPSSQISMFRKNIAGIGIRKILRTVRSL